MAVVNQRVGISCDKLIKKQGDKKNLQKQVRDKNNK